MEFTIHFATINTVGLSDSYEKYYHLQYTLLLLIPDLGHNIKHTVSYLQYTLLLLIHIITISICYLF